MFSTGGRIANGQTADPAPAEGDDTSWVCPICAHAVPYVRRPGRVRIYCTNACRHKAYRWRRVRRTRLQVADPPERAHSLDKTHALSDGVCSSCVALSGAPLRPLAEILDLITPLQRRAPEARRAVA